MPGQRGILGYKKDPKNLMLFTYTGEDWPSDDSWDSDYEPDDSDDGNKQKKSSKRKRKPVKKTSVKRRKKDNPDQDSSIPRQRPNDTSTQMKTPSHLAGQDLWGQHLPPELLLKIFQYAVSGQALPFLIRASRMCTLWRDTTLHSSLWSRVDLSYGWIKTTEQTLAWLAENRLSRCREINLSTWKNLTNKGLKHLCDHCPLLESINLSHCTKVNSEGITYMIDKCPQLAEVDLSFANGDAVSPQCLKRLVETQGPKLRHFNCSGNTLKGFNGIINSIASHCPNLECLDICNAHFSSDFLSLNIERLQAGCPQLKYLRLTNSKFRATSASARQQAESHGFPALVELSLAISTEGLIDMGIGMDDQFLHRLLKNSSKLRLLDLRGSTHLSTAGLQQLPCTDLQHLYISQSSTAKYDGIETIMHKWQHSLQELDLSWNVYPGMSLDLAMRKLSDNPANSRLESLNLSGTSISCSRLKSLLEGCPNLKKFNLCSCRGLPRGMKREYSGKSLETLRKDIDDIIEEHEGSVTALS